MRSFKRFERPSRAEPAAPHTLPKAANPGGNLLPGPALLYEKTDGIAHVIPKRPALRNSINGEMLCCLADAWQDVNDDSGVRTVKLTGAGVVRARSYRYTLDELLGHVRSAHGLGHTREEPPVLMLRRCYHESRAVQPGFHAPPSHPPRPPARSGNSARQPRSMITM